MSNKKSQEPTISERTLWPLWMAGKFLLAMLFLSMVALTIATWLSKSPRTFDLDGIQSRVTPSYMLALNQKAVEHVGSRWLSEKAADAAYTVYFRWTGIHSMVLKNKPAELATSYVQRIVAYNPDTVAVAMLMARLFGLRVGNLIFALPLLGLVVALAATDGLAERAIRRECGGRESATRFRIATKFDFELLPPVIGLFYLCLPIDVSLGSVMLWVMPVTFFMFRMKTKYYKKYL